MARLIAWPTDRPALIIVDDGPTQRTQCVRCEKKVAWTNGEGLCRACIQEVKEAEDD